jgi:dTDP-4-amino-4,6-dideoxygalactose transaminase
MKNVARLSGADSTLGVQSPLAPSRLSQPEVQPTAHVQTETDTNLHIPVLRPRLPDATALMPYLQRIDASRTYSNWGPLVTELGERLCEGFAMPRGGIVLANSGMAALVAAITAAAGCGRPGRTIAVVPDFTFTATGLAALQCGYEPALASCDAETWMFTPEQILAHPLLLEETGVVIPVAPFGRCIPQEPWLQFQDRTGIPVVIDGAACFESMSLPSCVGLGRLPVALSFHATKSFSTGEGGCVATTDIALAERVLQCLNFGFLSGRNSEIRGFNGKMSEYAAAVGLADLDRWPDKQREMLAVGGHYASAAEASGITDRLLTSPQVSSCYALLRCGSAHEAREVMSGLAAKGIDTRLWYGAGLHAHEVFKQFRLLDLHGDTRLDIGTIVGLPMAPDLSKRQAERICRTIRAHL